jgi:hypothetical protein
MNDKTTHVNVSGLGNFKTELREGETISVDGPATFKLISAAHNNNKHRILVVVIADKEVQIFKNYGGSFK